MMLIAVLYISSLTWKKKWKDQKWIYKMFVYAVPIGFIAIEAGWTVTEVGRQPWIIYGIMRTKDAVTPMPGLQYSFYLFTGVFLSLGAVIIMLLKRQIKMVPKLYDTTDPNYSPKK